jgi:hypothetical protein
MRSFRALSRRVLATVVAITLIAAAADLAHRADADFLARAVAAHDAAAHRVVSRPSAPAPEADHCYICHWVRSAHALTATGERVTEPSQQAAIVRMATPAPAREPSLASVPSRAPPR